MAIFSRFLVEKLLFLDFGLALLSRMQEYWLDNFRKVAHNIPEYVQEVWEDYNKIWWGALVSTV